MAITQMGELDEVPAGDTWLGGFLSRYDCAAGDSPLENLDWCRLIIAQKTAIGLILDTRGQTGGGAVVHPNSDDLLEILDPATWELRIGPFARLPESLTPGIWEIEIEFNDAQNNKHTWLAGTLKITPTLARTLQLNT